jgi:diaminohydroxyphosphoribosylaminopyrimidine deaminase/5-amino-6-(5-phosphoribosylamino)uracil reductase
MVIDYLELAINEAWQYQFLTYPNPAVGCTVVKNGQVLSVEAHQKSGEAHAEVLALKSAYLKLFPNSKIKNLTSSTELHQFLYENHNNSFIECEIYVTLEPCNHYGKTPACANLISIIKPKKVIIGYSDPNKKASGGIETLKNSNIEVEILNDNRCFNLLEPFIKWNENRFIFFKLAMSLNGVVTGGYISDKDSLKWVHNVRDKIDLLVIGGDTVRTDRPTLDSRFIEGNAPDVLIYSKQKDFDQSIPLFSVPNRKVFIFDSLKLVEKYNFIMVEGGEKLYNKLSDFVDWKLFIVSNKFINRENFKSEEKLDIIHQNKKEDNFIFAR